MTMGSFWRGKRVCITGIAGFVGAHLARRLVDLGASVMGVDVREKSPCLSAHRLNSIVHPDIDLEDVWDIESLLFGNRVHVLFHLAGVSHIRYAQERPIEAWRTNIHTTEAVLEACRLSREKPEAVVVASSNHIIGPQASWPANESAPLNQRDVYGASKICADIITQCYGQTLGVPAVALRHVNCYGPADPHGGHIVTHCTLACLKGAPPVLRNEGTARKAYLYIDDVVDAYLLLAERAQDLRGRSFWAAGEPVSVYDLASAAMRAAGMAGSPKIEVTDLDQTDYFEHLDDSALRGLGWAPKVSLDEGLRRTAQWYKEHGGMAWATS